MTISEYAQKFIGKSYVWGGNGSGKCGGGYDCSGLVLECLWAFGLIDNVDRTAQGIHDHLAKNGWHEVPRGFEGEGDLLFFGKSEKAITHTAICIGGGLMVEAGGGGSKCKTPATSTGKVQVRPIAFRGSTLVSALRKSK